VPDFSFLSAILKVDFYMAQFWPYGCQVGKVVSGVFVTNKHSYLLQKSELKNVDK